MTTIHLAYPDRDAAITALATHGLTIKDLDGNDQIPSVTFALGPRIDLVVAGGGTGVETHPTGETQPGPTGRPPLPVYAPLPGFWLMVAGEVLPDFGEAVVADGEGSILSPPSVAPSIPQQVPMWAAQAALKDPRINKYDAINAAILQMELVNAPVFFAWTMGNFASRQSAFIGLLAQQFGMTDPDIDAVFLLADKIAQVAG